jgi:Na+/melibiose symporter-like transporter
VADGHAAGVSGRTRQALSAFESVNGNRALRLFAVARLASVTGRWAATVALAVLAYNSGGATAVGILGVVRILPAALAGPIAAALLDRVSADRLLLLAGIGRTVAMGGAAAFAVGDHLPVVFALVGVESLLSTMVRPLQTSALPFLAKTPGELTAANLSLTTIESAGMLLGPALCGGLLAVWSPAAVLVVTTASYLLSAVLVARVPSWDHSGHVEHGSALSGTMEGVRAIRADPQLRLIVGLYCAENVVTGSLNVLIVIAALRLLNLGDSGVGVLNAAVGIGGLVGALGAAALLGRRRMASAFGAGLVLCGAPLVLIGLRPSTGLAVVLLAVLGVGVTIVDFSAVTLLQRAINDEVLAKVFSVLQSLFVGSIGLGAALAPILVSALGIRGALLASGVVLPVLAAALWRRLAPIDELHLVGDELVSLLRSVPIFAPLELPAIERLARAAVPVAVAGGEKIVVEAERGDRYYVIRDGEVEVSAGGEPLRRLRAGEGFGEIALLRDVPRTATVAAVRRTDLLAIERDEFLEVVNGSSSSREAADLVIDVRLGSLRSGLATV